MASLLSFRINRSLAKSATASDNWVLRNKDVSQNRFDAKTDALKTERCAGSKLHAFHFWPSVRLESDDLKKRERERERERGRREEDHTLK